VLAENTNGLMALAEATTQRETMTGDEMSEASEVPSFAA